MTTLYVSDAQPPLPLPSVRPYGRIPRPYGLEDLLRASAEVLGKGMYGTTYKATIESRPVMAVKHLKETSLPECEFQDKVAAIGGIDHPNIVLLQAAGLLLQQGREKLMVYDRVRGHVQSFLHASRQLRLWPGRR
ncbi:probable inactive receptor kinase RLK902 [Miscanthus floridulus]|uniref:probable inactive receptor kinase RLK902 n=1 Tax=Miscanthus floridulus TaxID=154761 RepID=UPI003459C52E